MQIVQKIQRFKETTCEWKHLQETRSGYMQFWSPNLRSRVRGESISIILQQQSFHVNTAKLILPNKRSVYHFVHVLVLSYTKRSTSPKNVSNPRIKINVNICALPMMRKSIAYCPDFEFIFTEGFLTNIICWAKEIRVNELPGREGMAAWSS